MPHTKKSNLTRPLPPLVKEALENSVAPLREVHQMVKKIGENWKIAIPVEEQETLIYSPPHLPQKQYITYQNQEFFCKGKYIDFPNTDDVYVKIVVVLYLKSDTNSICTYEVIDKFLVDEGEDTLFTSQDRRKRIHNALANLRRKRRRQKVAFPKRTPNGRDVIEKIPGIGLRFNNPHI